MQATTKYLIRWVAIPLTVGAAISLLVSLRWQAEGFFGNVATELIGIIVTVFFVDQVVRRRQEELWRPVTGRLPRRLRDYADSSARALQSILPVPSLIRTEDITGSGATGDLFERLATSASKVVFETIPILRGEQWHALRLTISNMKDGAETLLLTYREHLAVEEFAALATIESHLSDALVLYSESERLLPLPPEQLTVDERRTRESRIWMIAHNLQRAVLQLGRIGQGRLKDAA